MSHPKVLSKIIIKKVLLKNIDLFVDELESAKKQKIWITLVRPEYVISEFQLNVATFLAWRDFLQKTNKAKKFEIQILLRLLGETQITELMKQNPLEEGREYIALIITEDININGIEKFFKSLVFIEDNEELIKLTDEKREKILQYYKISENELNILNKRVKDVKELLEMLVIERMTINYLELQR